MGVFNLSQNLRSHSHLNLQDRLKVEALRRTNNGSISQILLAAISWYFVPSTSQAPFPLVIGLILIILMQGLRFGMIFQFQRRLQFATLLKNFNFFIFLSLATATLWAVLSLLVFHEFGIYSPQATIFILNVSGYIAGISYSLASVPRLQKFFIAFVGLPLVVSAIYEETPMWGAIVGIFGAFLVYLFAISRSHSSDLLYIYKSESDLRSEREKLRMVINSVPGFVAVSDPNGEWIEMSESFRALCRTPALEKAQIEFRNSKLEANVLEIDWTDQNQEYCYIVSFARLRYPENSIIIAGVPIHELKAIRREMEKQRSKLEFSARLSTIGEMAGGVAHEINNPLSVIVGSTFQLHHMLEEATTPNKQNLIEMVQKIESTALRISSIIRSLQYFAREGNNEPFIQASVPMIIENILNLFQKKFAHNKIDFFIEEVPDVSIPARPVQIGQVLINLLNNAFDAVSRSPRKRIELRFRQSENGLTFSVADSGPGLPLEYHDRIFQPFFTTKEIGQGSGLGLSVSQGIVEDHQGHLVLRTTPGQTTFEFTIPWKRQE